MVTPFTQVGLPKIVDSQGYGFPKGIKGRPRGADQMTVALCRTCDSECTELELFAVFVGGGCVNCNESPGGEAPCVDVVSLPQLRVAGEAVSTRDLSRRPVRELFHLPYG